MTSPFSLAEFPPISTEQWDEVVLKDGKGVPPKQKLYYRAEDLAGLEYLDSAPGRFPYTRGAADNNEWKVREAVSSIAEARAALESGAEELSYKLGDQSPEVVLAALSPDRCTIHFECGDRAADVVEALIARRMRGSVDYEPLADFDRAARLVTASKGVPDFRPITVRAHRFAEAGSTGLQELAFALAEGVEIIAQLTERGIKADQAAGSLAFSLAIGSNYFLEIARLRAARTLWARAVESFHTGSTDAARMVIHARTLHGTKTVYDSHVNLLRATTEAMAAAIGGADSLQVEAFDDTYGEGTPLSRRLARNTQLILKKEALLDRFVDPAGGSYYIEFLTDSLAREGWKLLQQIEAAGGFLKYSESGALERDIAKSRADRELAVSTRRRTILGTNQYPDPKERMLPKIERVDPSPRPARIFEDIRLRTERHAQSTGHTPRFLLLESGDMKMRKARSGFIANFFACAGFEIQIAESLTGDPEVVVLCSSDPEYAALAAKVIGELRAAEKSTPVLVAGNPTDAVEQLKQAGVADFIHVRSNAAETLRAWQERLGVKG
ncbi:MAG: methylmalonyl-CoA mutase family protein [Bryobacteraceae bacterium]